MTRGPKSTGRFARRAFWVATAALMVACVDESYFGEGDAFDGDAAVVPCTDGETRCVGQVHQTCVNGTFHPSEECDEPLVCAESIGCAACDPAGETGCKGRFVHRCLPDGTLGDQVKDCLGLPCQAGQCVDPGCAVGSRLVYVVDASFRLLSFDPSKEQNHFTLIAKLGCPAGAPWPWRLAPASPFSMSVDRSARAWVLYTSGEIFFVSTADGSCELSPYPKGQDGFDLFGMGFVSDGKGSSKEELFIAGAETGQGTKGLAYITPATLKVTEVGAVAAAEHSPELTGTGNGELYAYFPGSVSSFVARVNKSTGKTEKQWTVKTVPGQVVAWAFAHWGGKFYIFITAEVLGSERSYVLLLDPQDGTSTTFLEGIPYKIVGAGVSTCAPVID